MKDKIKKAAAISYDSEDSAPRVIAIGKGEIADKLISTAKANDIPIFKDTELVDTLLKIQIGEQIPPELYSVVAHILVFISDINKLRGELNGK